MGTPLSQDSFMNPFAQTDYLGLFENDVPKYKEVKDFLELDTNELSKISGISKSSVRFDDKIPAELKRRLTQIAHILAFVAEFFDGDARKTALWFGTPNPMLGGITPRDMLRLGKFNKLNQFIVDARRANVEEKIRQQ